jgi:hypothetical protein
VAGNLSVGQTGLGRSLPDEGNHDLTLAAKSSPDYDIFAASGRIQFFALSSSHVTVALGISGQVTHVHL